MHPPPSHPPGLVLVLDALVLARRGSCSADDAAASHLRATAVLAASIMTVMHCVLCIRLSYMGYNMVVLYGKFDIVLARFSRVSQPYATSHVTHVPSTSCPCSWDAVWLCTS